ncbi:unnamed protein product [Plutella xylostella]|uniref:(diamondback moth) hypothetical protein n=1 Tax=Plutella xylostella TaxID=51655 RepID=A0A8S4FAN7_PLUXY|nr:unnamed protein product [Plutella xylostella]
MKRSFQDEFLKAVAAKNLTNNVGVGEDSQNNTNFTCKNKKPRGRKRKQSFNTIADEEDDWYELHSQRKKKASSRSSNKEESTAVITAICEDAEEPNPATDDPLAVADYDQDITSTIIKDEDLIEQIEDEMIKTEYIIQDLETSHRSSPEITNVLINISQCIVSTTRLNDMAVLNMESKLTPQEIFAAIDIESRPTIIKACDFLEQRNSLDFDELQERIGELNQGIQINTTKTAESSLLVQPNFNVGPCKISNEVPKDRGVTGSSDVSTSALWQHVETKEEYIDKSNTKQTGARHYTKLKKKLQVLLIDFHTTSSKVSPPKIDSNKAPAKKTTKTPTPCDRKQVIDNARKEMTTNVKKNVANVMKNFSGLRLAIDKDKKVQALLSNVKNIAALSTTELSQLKAFLEQAQVIADRYNIESGTQLAHILGMNVSPVHTLPSNIPVTAACVKNPALDMPVITTAPSLPNPVPLQPKPNYCIIKMTPIPTDVTQKQAVYVTNTTPKCQPTHFDGAVNLLAKATVSDTTVIKTMPIITSVTSLGSGNSSAVLIPNNLTPSVTKTSKDLTPAVIRVRKEICKSQTITEPVASTSAGLWYKTPDNKPITDDRHDATESVVYNVNSEEYQRNLLDAETGEEVKTNFDDDWDLATLKKNIISDMIDIKEDQISEYGSDINKIDHQ